MHGATSPKLVRRVKKPQNQRPVLKPLIDPDFNYNTVRKNIDQKLINPNFSELMASFTNDEEYHEIKVHKLAIILQQIYKFNLKDERCCHKHQIQSYLVGTGCSCLSFV